MLRTRLGVLLMHAFLESLPRFVFFTGKGGVGKTSLACATAVRLSEQGKRVLLTSTDPASNVGHTFGLSVGNAITAVPQVPGLDAFEIDPEAAAAEYRERIIGPVRDLLPAAEIASMTEQLSGSCTTEVASFNEFTAFLADPAATGEYDHVIFDTAPTGHTIRLLQLPGEWTRFLDRGKGDASCLGPLAGLDKRRAEYARAVEVLGDPGLSRLVLVARAQTASLGEVARTAGELVEVGFTSPHLVVNAVLPAGPSADPLAEGLRRREAEALASMPAALRELPRSTVELLPVDTVGVEALRALLGDRSSVAVPSAGPVVEVEGCGLAPLIRELESGEGPARGLVLCMGKGGVGKTTVAAALAVAMAQRGHDVHLTTTDPASHLTQTLGEEIEGLEVSSIDPRRAVEEYRERMLASRGKDLDEAGRVVLEEDLRSPCTEEIAVFQQFSRAVSQSRRRLVIMDTAPTGHTLLLMDATGSYHRQMVQQLGEDASFTTPLMRLQDPTLTHAIIVTLPETTPVLEAKGLADDLVRAGITPWAWVVNQSLAAAAPTDALLAARAGTEVGPLSEVSHRAERLAVIPMLAEPPVGSGSLLRLSEEQ